MNTHTHTHTHSRGQKNKSVKDYFLKKTTIDIINTAIDKHIFVKPINRYRYVSDMHSWIVWRKCVGLTTTKMKLNPSFKEDKATFNQWHQKRVLSYRRYIHEGPSRMGKKYVCGKRGGVEECLAIWRLDRGEKKHTVLGWDNGRNAEIRNTEEGTCLHR